LLCTGEYFAEAGLATAHAIVGVEGFNPLPGKPRIILGTPGRIMDALLQAAEGEEEEEEEGEKGKGKGSRQAALLLPGLKETIKVIVLDEADEMLARGFAPQVHAILQCLGRGVGKPTKSAGKTAASAAAAAAAAAEEGNSAAPPPFKASPSGDDTTGAPPAAPDGGVRASPLQPGGFGPAPRGSNSSLHLKTNLYGPCLPLAKLNLGGNSLHQTR
jgi:hypothetical protein